MQKWKKLLSSVLESLLPKFCICGSPLLLFINCNKQHFIIIKLTWEKYYIQPFRPSNFYIEFYTFLKAPTQYNQKCSMQKIILNDSKKLETNLTQPKENNPYNGEIVKYILFQLKKTVYNHLKTKIIKTRNKHIGKCS